MALNLNFRGKVNASSGNPTLSGARGIVSSQFGKVGLNPKAKGYFTREISKAGSITGKEFDEIVNKAHKEGIIDANKAEKIKDVAKLPDSLNKHWNI